MTIKCTSGTWLIAKQTRGITARNHLGLRKTPKGLLMANSCSFFSQKYDMNAFRRSLVKPVGKTIFIYS